MSFSHDYELQHLPPLQHPESPGAEAAKKRPHRTHSEVWGPLCRSVPTSQCGPIVDDDITRYNGRPLAVITIGLPARGKSHFAHKLCRYCNWIGIEARTYISVSYAARIVETTQQKFNTDFLLNNMDLSSHTHWQPILDLICKEIKEFIGNPKKSVVAVLDMLCCTAGLRKYIYDQLREVLDHDRIIFLEIVIDDEKCEHLLRAKAQSPEYAGFTMEEALADIRRRIDGFKQHYETVTDDFTYIRANNCRHTLNKIKGYLPSRIVNWVLNTKIAPNLPPFFLFPPPENAFSMEDRLGGDPDLTENGRDQARQLFEYMKDLYGPSELEVWASGLRRSVQTAEPFEKAGYVVKRWLALNEIHMGQCEGLTRKEVTEKFPFIEELRKNNKYYFRFPQGESYLDLVTRLDRIILSLDRAEKPVLVLGHRAVLRELIAYYHESPAEEGVQWQLPAQTLWKVQNVSGAPPIVEEVLLGDQSLPLNRLISGDNIDEADAQASTSPVRR